MNNAQAPERDISALAQAIAVDSGRIDGLVEQVGYVRGTVEKVDGKVDELRSAMAVLVKHEVLMEQQRLSVADLRDSHRASIVEAEKDREDMDRRLKVVEAEIPPLKEARAWVVRGLTLVVTAVLVALLALVVKP